MSKWSLVGWSVVGESVVGESVVGGFKKPVCLSGVETIQKCAIKIFTGHGRFLRIRVFQ